jgi:hypothetical protein
MLTLFPTLLQGPLGTVDTLYKALRLDRIVEIQPLIPSSRLEAGEYRALLGRVVLMLGIALFALPFLALRLFTSPPAERAFWVVISLGLLLFLPLAIHQVRWSGYLQILLILPYAALIVWQVGRLAGKTHKRWLSVLRPLFIVLGLFWPVLVTAALPQSEPKTVSDACSVAEIAPTLDRLADGRSRTILAHTDLGSELLYRTQHSVLSIPNHRPQPGFAATHRIFTSNDDLSAQQLLADHHVEWILLCPSAIERSFSEAGEAAGPTLYQRLAARDVPAWLRPLDLPPFATGTPLLYEVGPEAPHAGGVEGGQ